MKASRTEPTVHCWQRRINGDYVTAAHTTHDHLAAVFAAERERLAAAKAPPPSAGSRRNHRHQRTAALGRLTPSREHHHEPHHHRAAQLSRHPDSQNANAADIEDLADAANCPPFASRHPAASKPKLRPSTSAAKVLRAERVEG